MALFKVGAAALFESMESDVSSRTIRMTNFPQQWQGLSEAPHLTLQRSERFRAFQH